MRNLILPIMKERTFILPIMRVLAFILPIMKVVRTITLPMRARTFIIGEMKVRTPILALSNLLKSPLYIFVFQFLFYSSPLMINSLLQVGSILACINT